MGARASPGIGRLAYRLPSTRASLRTLEGSGHLSSSASTLRSFGFRYCYVQAEPSRFEELVVGAASDALGSAGFSREDIDTVLLYSGLGAWMVPAATVRRSALKLFRYPVARIADRLELSHASALALSQMGCSGLLFAVDLAAAMLRTSDRKAVLCVAGDVLPPGSRREVMYNVMSDAAAAAIVEREGAKNEIVAFRQLSQPSYWDSPTRENELIAAYFPLAERVITASVAAAGLRLADIRWFVPNNVSLRSWAILAEVLQIPLERVWTENIARVGHTVSCDHIINLVDMERRGALEPGDHLLLFTFGFGASWSSLVLRH